MRKTAFAALLAIALMAVSGHHASAQSLGLLQVNNENDFNIATPVLLATDTIVSEPTAPAQPEIQKYTVASGDTLTKVAENHDTTWKRLYDKNETVSDPDMLQVGIELTIPKPDEQLPDRPLPTPPVAEEVPAPAPAKPAARTTAAVQYRGSVSGNTYTPGYCTWYVKNKKPSLPNNLGNAYAWVANAQAMGMATGSIPRVGAAGQAGNHVVYVEAVNGDGTVTISEMNHAGLYVITWRTLPASYFQYIY
jgi:surface antigen